MKGWLSCREGSFMRRSERFFFRLRWGFLSRHVTESTVALTKYLLHGATVVLAKNGLKINIEVGPLGSAYAQVAGKLFHQRLVLIGDDINTVQAWLTGLFRARNRTVENWFTIKHVVGQGATADVLLGIDKHDPSSRVAIKRIRLCSRLDIPAAGLQLCKISKEIQTQQKASSRSRYVASVLDVFYNSSYCYIVFEYANKGSLSQLLDFQQGAVPEELVRSIAIQIGRCLLALHQNNIVHRDVKCDNVILRQMGSSALHAMLTDFGFATTWKPDSTSSVLDFCKNRVGTTSYMAPEIWDEKLYGTPVDIFSFGVLCHVCLTGEFPFQCSNPANNPDFSTRLDYLDEAVAMRTISPEASSFCKQLLQKSPNKRPTAVALLQHRWLRSGLVTMQPRRRLSASTSSKVVLRRVFHAICALRAMQKLAFYASSNSTTARGGSNGEQDRSQRRMQIDLDIFEAHDTSQRALGAALKGSISDTPTIRAREQIQNSCIDPAIFCLRSR